MRVFFFIFSLDESVFILGVGNLPDLRFEIVHRSPSYSSACFLTL